MRWYAWCRASVGLFGGMGRIHLGEPGIFQQAGHLGTLEFMIVQYQDLVFG